MEPGDLWSGREGQRRGSKGTGTSTSPFHGSGKSPTWSYPRVLGWWVPMPCYKVPHLSMGAEPGRGKTWRLGLELIADEKSGAPLGGSVWGCRPGHGFAWVFHSCHWPDPTFSPLVLHLKPSLWPVSWGWECNLSLRTYVVGQAISFSKNWSEKYFNIHAHAETMKILWTKNITESLCHLWN